VADLAARLRREHRWKLPDALQVAAAQHHGLRLVTRNTRDFPPERYPFVLVPYVVSSGAARYGPGLGEVERAAGRRQVRAALAREGQKAASARRAGLAGGAPPALSVLESSRPRFARLSPIRDCDCPASAPAARRGPTHPPPVAASRSCSPVCAGSAGPPR